MFDTFDICGSGLTAHRLWLDTIANNVANMNSTGRPGDAENPPYRRQVPVFTQVLQRKMAGKKSRSAGVSVTGIVADPGEPRLVYNPAHPHAGPDGYVAYPNINITNEMTNMMAATRAYEANATTLQAAKDMALTALQIGRG